MAVQYGLIYLFHDNADRLLNLNDPQVKLRLSKIASREEKESSLVISFKRLIV